jgi:hypothetical protein
MVAGAVVLLSATLAVAGPRLTAHADSHPITVDGQILCRDPILKVNMPLAGARIELYDAYNTPFGHLADDGITFLDDHFGTTHTNPDGTFSVSGDRGQASDVYVRIVLDDDNGVHLTNFGGNDENMSSFHFTNPKYTHVDSGTVHLGSWLMQNPQSSFPSECVQFVAAKRAFDNYTQIVGAPPPTNGFTIDEASFLTFGVPWTSLSGSVWSPSFTPGKAFYKSSTGVGIPVTMLHEFAHAVRHSFDGDFGHWLGDVAAYNYIQQHKFCQVTNPGFAFNEGWAEFWSNQIDTTGCTPGNMSQEGNVASSLKNLQDQCLAGSADARRKKMVSVLALAGHFAIHSFSDYLSFFNQIFNGCIEHFEQVNSTFRFTGEDPGDVSPVSDRIARVQSEITADNGQLSALNASLQSAVARKKSLGRVSCATVPCLAAFDTLVDIPLLQTKIAQVKLLIKRMNSDISSLSKNANLADPDTYYNESLDNTTVTHKDVLLGYAGLTKALAAVGPLLTTDAGGQLNEPVQLLRSRIEDLADLAVDATGTRQPAAWLGPQLLTQDVGTSATPAALSVSIDSPANGAGITDPTDCLDPAANVQLIAVAIDPVDGPLTGSSVTWSDTISGNLGSGSSLSRSMLPPTGGAPPASDTITVTATNSLGQTATASTTECLDQSSG